MGTRTNKSLIACNYRFLYDTDQAVIDLCHSAKTEAGSPVVICVYRRFAPITKRALQKLGLEQMKVVIGDNYSDTVGSPRRHL
ncbi:MAG: hypothetical protein KAG53_05275 [Endozoicomonadaceae bacterium]|nr:hypothetical protein [Endozoicomonadaceae bacterium]